MRLRILALMLLPSVAFGQPASTPRQAAGMRQGAGDGTVSAGRRTAIIDLKQDCGARGNGTADDSGALRTCIDRENATYAAGKPAVIYVPPGIYLIKATHGTMPRFAPHVPGAIIGAGPLQSIFQLDPAYPGTLFAWSEAWMDGVAWRGPRFLPRADYAGPLVEGIAVAGDKSSSRTQNAFAFLDRDDHVLMRDVDVLFLHGACIAMGNTLAEPEAYVRESAFYDVKCWESGTPTQPAVQISSTTDGPSSDATNEVKFFGLDLFGSAGTGIAISDPRRWGSTRAITFYNARVEASGKDGIDIGLPTDQGEVQGIRFFNLDEPGIAPGYYGLKITTGGAFQPYAITVIGGQIGSGAGRGVDIDDARLVDLELDNMATSRPGIMLGRKAGPDIMVRGNGAEYGYTYDVPAAVQRHLALPALNHAAASSGAIDLQTGGRSSASGAGAFAAGRRNVLSGTASSAPGGQDADDFGRDGWRGQASGDFSRPGDAQFGRMVLRASTNSMVKTQLTAGGPASRTTIPAVQSDSAQTFSVQLIARDVTAAGNSLSYTMPVALVQRGSTPASTTVSVGRPVMVSAGAGSRSQVAIVADTINGGIAVDWTAPNHDIWHVVATVRMTEVR